jgi:hypothetical protein
MRIMIEVVDNAAKSSDDGEARRSLIISAIFNIIKNMTSN